MMLTTGSPDKRDFDTYSLKTLSSHLNYDTSDLSSAEMGEMLRNSYLATDEKLTGLLKQVALHVIKTFPREDLALIKFKSSIPPRKAKIP